MRQTGVQPSRAEQLSLLGPTRGGMLPASRVGRALHVPGLLPVRLPKRFAVLTQGWIRCSSSAGSARSSRSWASQWACCQPSRPRLRSAPPPSPATSPTPRVGSRVVAFCVAGPGWQLFCGVLPPWPSTPPKPRVGGVELGVRVGSGSWLRLAVCPALLPRCCTVVCTVRAPPHLDMYWLGLY